MEETARLRKEIEPLREKSRRLSASNEALLEIFKCAGNGGLDLAKQIVKILEGYEIFQKEAIGKE